MKTKRLNWVHIIIGVAGLLLASCAVDDGDMTDFGSIVDNDESQTYKNSLVGGYEGYWFSIDNDKEPIGTAILTLQKDGSMSLSAVPCEEVIHKLREKGADVVSSPSSDTSFSLVDTSNSLSLINSANSNTSLFFELTDESLVFPLGGELINGISFDELTIRLAPRKSIAVFDTVNNQWGIFLYYQSALVLNRENGDRIDCNCDLGYKFISTKRLK